MGTGGWEIKDLRRGPRIERRLWQAVSAAAAARAGIFLSATDNRLLTSLNVYHVKLYLNNDGCDQEIRASEEERLEISLLGSTVLRT